MAVAGDLARPRSGPAARPRRRVGVGAAGHPGQQRGHLGGGRRRARGRRGLGSDLRRQPPRGVSRDGRRGPAPDAARRVDRLRLLDRGQRGEARHSAYAASKGALISYTKSLAEELGPRGVRVNCVAPGWVDTDMAAATLAQPGRRLEIEREIPLGRVASPSDIAGPDPVPGLGSRPARPGRGAERQWRERACWIGFRVFVGAGLAPARGRPQGPPLQGCETDHGKARPPRPAVHRGLPARDRRGRGDHGVALPAGFSRGVDRVSRQSRRGPRAGREAAGGARQERRRHALRGPVLRGRDGQGLSGARAGPGEGRRLLRAPGQGLAVADAMVPLGRPGGGARLALAVGRAGRLPIGHQGGRAGGPPRAGRGPGDRPEVPGLARRAGLGPQTHRGLSRLAPQPHRLDLRGRAQRRALRRRHPALQHDGLGRHADGLPGVRVRPGGVEPGLRAAARRRTRRPAPWRPSPSS